MNTPDKLLGHISIGLPWDTPSGTCEYDLIGWTDPDNAGRRLPVAYDGDEEIVWGSDFAVFEADGWRFPDGELCSKPGGLLKAFQRRQRCGDGRQAATTWEFEPLLPPTYEETIEILEEMRAKGLIRAATHPDGSVVMKPGKDGRPEPCWELTERGLALCDEERR